MKETDGHRLRKIGLLALVVLSVSLPVVLYAKTGDESLLLDRGKKSGTISPSVITVSPDRTGDFTTVQAAVDSVPQGNTKPVMILIKPGIYKERIVVPRSRPFIRFIGEDPEKTILTFDLNARMLGDDGEEIGTFRTPSTTIEADDFSAENITFENSAGPIGQALAIAVIGDRVVFRNCRFLGWQDTILDQTGRHYYENCYIAGHVDFIFGGATSFYDTCHIHCLRKGYITAAATPEHQPYGYVFSNCKITGESPEVKTYLGRPWRDYANVIFLNTEMSDVVRPEGWHNWNKPHREKTSRYAEYGSTGPGANPQARVPWARQLTEDQTKAITLENVLAGEDGWNPRTGEVRPACTAEDVTKQPGIILPADGSTSIVADTVIFTWPQVPGTSGYSVYVGKSADKMALAAKVKANSYKSDILEVFTDYYWQVIAQKGDEQVKSPVWRFKTAQKAFPSAEGFGKFILGGRGGKVIKVTNLNDSGPGSLRAAINTKGPRIIVFDVAGTIMIKSPLIITEPYVTIAGQTAPGDGVAVVGHGTMVAANDVIIRYMRFRATDLAGVAIDALDNSWEGGQTARFIFDHCSVSWGIDETLSATYQAVCTVQWCLVSESLAQSVHPKGRHGYGGIWGSPASSFHHNLLAHHTSRNPRFDGGIKNNRCLIDHRNNVIYNWGFNSAYGAEDDRVNIINNYYKAGPATRKSCSNRIFQATDPNTRMYINGNYVDGFPEITKDNWAGGIDFKKGYAATEKTLRVEVPFDVVPVPTTSAEQAYKDVLAKVGDVFPVRDSLDQRVINEVRTGTAKYGKRGDGIIDSQFDLCPQKGKCPRCSAGDYCWLPKLKSAKAPQDTDNDGMPDSWERKYGLNPADASDAGKDRDKDGYTNIEEYINSLVGDVLTAG